MRIQIRVFAFVCLFASATFAAQIPLPTTLDNLLGTTDFISVSGLQFDSFEYARTGDMPPPSAINVLAITDSEGNAGIRFQGGFVDSSADGASDALIEFSVTATGPWISDAHLTGNPDLLGGEGLASVTETFIPVTTNDSISIYDNGTIEQLSDMIIFDTPVQQLQVQKDIVLLASTNSAGAAISFVDQSFSVVPEPASYAGLLLGAISLLALRRRR